MTLAQNSCPDAAIHRSTGVTALIHGVARSIIGTVRNRIKRAAFRRMLTMDDRMLKDVGVTRGDVHWASELPMNVNAGAALRRESLKVRKSAL